jgi:hypothetical protein
MRISETVFFGVAEPWDFESFDGKNRFSGKICDIAILDSNKEYLIEINRPFILDGKLIEYVVAILRNKQIYSEIYNISHIPRNLISQFGKTTSILNEESFIMIVSLVWKSKCDCNEHLGLSIYSNEDYKIAKVFLENRIDNNIFVETDVLEPYYVGKGKHINEILYADKWYLCAECGCLWEFCKPEFPAFGFVRKFADGVYKRDSRGYFLRFGQNGQNRGGG